MRVACFHFGTDVDLQRIAEDCLRFSPQIAVREPNAIFLEIGKCYRLYSESTFLDRALVLLRRLGIQSTIGVGESIEWALIAAKFGTSDISQLPIEALYDLSDPLNRDTKGQTLVAKLVNSAGLLGIKNLAGFKMIPRNELASRFGPSGLLCRQKLDNEFMIPWKPWLPLEVIEDGIEYPYADYQGGVEPLLFDSKRLLDRIFVRLRFRGLKAAALKISIVCEKLSIAPDNERNLSLTFLLPQSETKGALSILRDFFGKEFDRRPLLAPVEKFIISVSSTTAGYSGQKNLFHAREERKEAAAALMAQLGQAYGKENIFKAQSIEERIPELSRARVAEIKGQAALKERIPLRPTHLIKPELVKVTPQFVYLRNKPYRMIKWSEVREKISVKWDEELVERTYFQVEVEDGPLLWIYSEQDHVYYLHGYYG